MKVGIFADVHGNIYAFEKICKSLMNDRLDFYIFCGDICGYYYYQNEVIEILKDIRNLICITGNHDEIFLRMLRDNMLDSEYELRYGKSNSFLKKSIEKESLTFIEELPEKYVFEEYDLAVFHGSPWDYLNEYVYPTDSLDRFQNLPYRFVLLGHTHYPMDRKAGNVRVINPGSCGQPRDFNQPSYAILDLKSESVKFKRIQYNTNLMIKDIIKHEEENTYLMEILKRIKEIRV